jgi:hypothetical protein
MAIFAAANRLVVSSTWHAYSKSGALVTKDFAAAPAVMAALYKTKRSVAVFTVRRLFVGLPRFRAADSQSSAKPGASPAFT